MIERPRLASKLREALEPGSLLVIAGAGFGKTTILEQALRDNGAGAVAWIACTETDREPGQLLLRLVRGISEALPGAADVVAERLATAPERIDASAATDQLLTDLGDLLVEPLFLVLDDAEQLEGAPDSLALISRLLRAEVPALRIAVASRRQLELRTARLRTAGRLTEVGSADLAFTAEESAELLRTVSRREPEQEEIEAVVSATQGWPLGVAMLAAGPREADRAPGREANGQASTAHSRANLHAYLAEEVLDALHPELREAVVESSVPSKLTPEVLEALDLPDDFLPAIERAGVPVRRLVADGGSFAYHPLFREFLLSRLQAERDEASRRRLQARVAPAVAVAGEPIEALELWLDAEEWPDVIASLDRHGPDLVRTSPGLVRNWLDRVPSEVRSDPGLAMLEGQLEWGTGDHHRAARLLSEAVEGLRARGDSAREWIARFTLSDSLATIGDFEGSARAAEGFDSPEALDAGPFAPATAIWGSIYLAAVGRFDESERLVERARRHPGAYAIGSVDTLRLPWIDWPQGNVDAALELTRAALRESKRYDPFNVRLYLLTTLGVMLDELGRREASIAQWGAVEEVARESLASFLVRVSHNWRAKLHAQAGRLREAEKELARGGPSERGWRGHVHDLACACIGALRGDPEMTSAAAQRALAIQRAGPTMFRSWTAADLVPALARVGNRRRAWSVLEEAMGLVEETYPGAKGRFLRARLLALRAWLRYGDGDEAGAQDDLDLVWRDAANTRPFILRREWERLQPLIWSALERRTLDPTEAVDAIADAFPEGAPLVPFIAHPVAEVRRAALDPAIASGHPEAARRLRELVEDRDRGVAAVAGRARERLAESAPPLRFQLLGGFSVRRGAWRIQEEAWGRPAAARVVRFLLLHRGETVPEDAIFEALWPKLSPAGARRSLQVAVSRARHALDLPNAAHTVLESIDGSYRLRLGERDTLDSEEFEAAAQAALAERGPDQRRMLERARSLWGGEPLPAERYSEWTIGWRERLSDRYIEVLTALAGLYAAAGDHPSVIRAAREMVELDPLNEGAHRELMAAYARAGRTGHALRQYLECRRALVEDLGTEPAEATSRLQARILAGEPV